MNREAAIFSATPAKVSGTQDFYSALITRDLQKTVVAGTRKFEGIGHTHFSHTTNNQHITK